MQSDDRRNTVGGKVANAAAAAWVGNTGVGARLFWLSSKELAGSYCIKQGTAYTPQPPAPCQFSNATDECGPYNGVE